MNRATPSTHPKLQTNAFLDVMTRLQQSITARREAARADRELASVLAGHHGPSMREELLAVLNR